MASFSHLLAVLIVGISANTSFADTMYKSIRPDGKIVLIAENDGSTSIVFNINYNGKIAPTSLDAGAVATYIF